MPIAAVDSLVCAGNSVLGTTQRIIYSRSISQTQLEKPPIFILGHWRSGTTLLHELLGLDDNHMFPTNYQCFSPNHFLLTEKLFTRLFSFLLPKQRPMDNMDLSWHKPQEDEFALCNLGIPSPYLSMAFPNRPREYEKYSDLDSLSPEEKKKWQQAWLLFLKAITYRTAKRLVLKSPLHTFRVPTLLEMFPDALFVNLVRDPFATYASTTRLWRCLYQAHGLQTPLFDTLEQETIDTGKRMFQHMERARVLIPQERLVELRYEDLVRNPIEELRALYEQLGLENFERLQPKLQEYFHGKEGYRPNRHELTTEQRNSITNHWLPYFERFGYQRKTATV